MSPVALILLVAVSASALIAPGFVGQAKSHASSSRTTTFAWSALPLQQQQKMALESSIMTRTALLAATGGMNDAALYDDTCDVLVLGSGPAARAISSLLSKNLNVLMADANYEREWAPNYGVWRDEWDAIVEAYEKAGVMLNGGLVDKCIDREWALTDCFFGGSFDIPMEERTRLDRPYCRVDKNALQESLSSDNYRVLHANHVSTATSANLYAPAGSLLHDETGTTIRLEAKDGTPSIVRTKLVVDCTGHESKLVLKDTKSVPNDPPGFQIAYGALVEVDESSSTDLTQIGPYYKEAMTLFDYRTDHFDGDETRKRNAAAAPTFMYAMPLKDNRIFFEETSLVARPAISFQECKDRYLRRMEHLGIKITKVEEEEFCYIPMGGPLPLKNQRIVGLGGAAAMVHPSTGYHLSRVMMAATDMAKAIESELSNPEPNLDRAAANAYHAVWAPDNIRQRNFAVFGGEFLMKQDVKGLRGFFDGFFKLPLPLWGGFLAGWPGLPNNEKHETWLARLWFGLNFIVRIPFPVAFDMFINILTYSVTGKGTLPQSVTPLLGEPTSYEYEEYTANVGDVAAKNEAMEMIMASRVTEEVPVAFDDDTKDGAIGEVGVGSFQ